jgi:hypothetical protein
VAEAMPPLQTEATYVNFLDLDGVTGVSRSALVAIGIAGIVITNDLYVANVALPAIECVFDLRLRRAVASDALAVGLLLVREC